MISSYINDEKTPDIDFTIYGTKGLNFYKKTTSKPLGSWAETILKTGLSNIILIP